MYNKIKCCSSLSLPSSRIPFLIIPPSPLPHLSYPSKKKKTKENCFILFNYHWFYHLFQVSFNFANLLELFYNRFWFIFRVVFLLWSIVLLMVYFVFFNFIDIFTLQWRIFWPLPEFLVENINWRVGGGHISVGKLSFSQEEKWKNKALK